MNAVYLRRLYEAETCTAAALRAMAQDTVPAKKKRGRAYRGAGT